MDLKKLISKHWPLILYFVLSIFSVLAFFASGFFRVHDDVQVARVYEMTQALASWMFPVRWVRDLGYGLGYPLFNFYSVLPYYMGGVLNLFGLNLLTATKTVFIIGIIGAGVSMYFLTEKIFGKIPALVSAVIYLFFPYHAVNIYIRGDLAELFAYFFLPLAFLSFFKIHTEDTASVKYIILGSLSIAAVILSHNLSAFMLFIFLGIFIIFSLIASREKKRLFISYSTVLLIAFLLSAFYAVPASLEAKYTNVMTQISGGSDWHNHFVCPWQLWDSPWGFGGSAPGCVDGFSFRLGKLNIIFVIASVLFALFSLVRLKKKNGIVLISIFFLIFSIFMTTEYSSFLWNFPFMNFLQFPWRFLNFTGLFLSFLIGYGIWFIQKEKSAKVGLFFGIMIIASTLIINVKLFFPQKILNRDSGYYSNKHYLNWTASKISDEYLPKGFVSPKFEQDPTSRNSIIFSDFFRNSNENDSDIFRFDETPLEKGSDLLSIIGACALLIVIIKKPRVLKMG